MWPWRLRASEHLIQVISSLKLGPSKCQMATKQAVKIWGLPEHSIFWTTKLKCMSWSRETRIPCKSKGLEQGFHRPKLATYAIIVLLDLSFWNCWNPFDIVQWKFRGTVYCHSLSDQKKMVLHCFFGLLLSFKCWRGDWAFHSLLFNYYFMMPSLPCLLWFYCFAQCSLGLKHSFHNQCMDNPESRKC